MNKWRVETISQESQGFTRTTSSSRLVYNYSQAKKNTEEDEKPLKVPMKTMEIASPSRRCPGIANRAAVFETNTSSSPNKTKDPALLSVAERKALFERNKGDAPPMPRSVTKKYPAPKPPIQEATKPTTTNTGIASKMVALLENKTTIGQAQIENGVRQQRQKEMEQLLNRFNKNQMEIVDDDSDGDDENTAMIAATTTKPLVVPQGGAAAAIKRLSEFLMETKT